MLSRLDPAPVLGRRVARPAVFMDKDGTLIENVPYNVDTALIRWMPGAAEALRALHDAGYEIVVVSNQSGVGEGYFEERALIAVEQTLRRMALEAGVELAGFFYCPHSAATGCDCRKPLPGLIHRAAREHALDTATSWLIGDIISDVEAGNRAGCRSILVGPEPVPPNCSQWQQPFAKCTGLLEAADVILENKEDQG